MSDPLRDAFMELAVGDLTGKASPKPGMPVSEKREDVPISKDIFAQMAMQDTPPRVPIKEREAVKEATPIIEQFIKEAESETQAMLKKMLRGIR